MTHGVCPIIKEEDDPVCKQIQLKLSNLFRQNKDPLLAKKQRPLLIIFNRKKDI